jgi:hypothetical protein
VLGLVKVFGGVLVLRGIATPNVAADEALAKMDPGVPHLEAFFAAFTARFDVAYFAYVRTGRTGLGHGIS